VERILICKCCAFGKKFSTILEILIFSQGITFLARHVGSSVAQSLTVQAVLVAERGDLFVPRTRTLGSERFISFHLFADNIAIYKADTGGASSSQLQLSGTHCHFTFAPRPSVAVSFEQGSRLIFLGWSFNDFSSENY